MKLGTEVQQIVAPIGRGRSDGLWIQVDTIKPPILGREVHQIEHGDIPG